MFDECAFVYSTEMHLLNILLTADGFMLNKIPNTRSVRPCLNLIKVRNSWFFLDSKQGLVLVSKASSSLKKENKTPKVKKENPVRFLIELSETWSTDTG